jgi:D-erythro-7,8-dihydroneopterin triphosphate epimerase
MSSIATIRIKNLRLRTFIGIKDEEIHNQQDVLINASIRYNADKAISENCIESALNYRTITKQVIELVEDNRFALLERMTNEILSIIMVHKDVIEATVEIDKPYALRYADSVSVSLTATQDPL